MADVLMYGDTYRMPELRHEVPIGIPDPFLYAERGGVKQGRAVPDEVRCRDRHRLDEAPVRPEIS